MNELLIPLEKSVIVAADVEADKLSPLVKATSQVPLIGGYKVGLVLGLELSLPETVRRVKEHTPLPVIYDHQKAGNDIPEMGSQFARVCKQAGVDAVILFPFASRKTHVDWVKAAQDAGLGILVGGHMTQPEFLNSECGYIADDAPERIYSLATTLGIRDFVVPGNKVEYVTQYRELLENLLGVNNFALYAPGFITQGGDISEMAKVAGNRWHAIVGSAIYKATDMTAAAELMISQIKTLH